MLVVWRRFNRWGMLWSIPATDGLSMDSSRATVRDLRRRNRSAVLSRLYFDGPLSRLELAELTGLSQATVRNVTGALAEERLIPTAAQGDSDRRRPPVPR